MVVFKIIFPLAGLSWRPAAGGLRFAPPAGVVVGVVVAAVAVVVLVLALVLDIVNAVDAVDVIGCCLC